MIEERLKELNLSLPEPSKPLGFYIPSLKVGNLVFLSGVISKRKGKIGENISVDDGKVEAERCMLQLLSNLKAHLGSLDKVKRVVRVEGFVNSKEGFVEQPKVINGASELLFNLFGEKGKHSRIAVGVNELPLGSCLEISMIVEVEDE